MLVFRKILRTYWKNDCEAEMYLGHSQTAMTELFLISWLFLFVNYFLKKRMTHYLKYRFWPNFLVLKFCRKVQFLHSFGQIIWNSGEAVPFYKISIPGDLVRLRYFTQWQMLYRILYTAYFILFHISLNIFFSLLLIENFCLNCD